MKSLKFLLRSIILKVVSSERELEAKKVSKKKFRKQKLSDDNYQVGLYAKAIKRRSIKMVCQPKLTGFLAGANC